MEVPKGGEKMIIRVLGHEVIDKDYCVTGYKEYLNLMTALIRVKKTGTEEYEVVTRKYIEVDYMRLPSECVMNTRCVLPGGKMNWTSMAVKAMEMKYEWIKEKMSTNE